MKENEEKINTEFRDMYNMIIFNEISKRIKKTTNNYNNIKIELKNNELKLLVKKEWFGFYTKSSEYDRKQRYKILKELLFKDIRNPKIKTVIPFFIESTLEQVYYNVPIACIIREYPVFPEDEYIRYDISSWVLFRIDKNYRLHIELNNNYNFNYDLKYIKNDNTRKYVFKYSNIREVYDVLPDINKDFVKLFYNYSEYKQISFLYNSIKPFLNMKK